MPPTSDIEAKCSAAFSHRKIIGAYSSGWSLERGLQCLKKTAPAALTWACLCLLGSLVSLDRFFWRLSCLGWSAESWKVYWTLFPSSWKCSLIQHLSLCIWIDLSGVQSSAGPVVSSLNVWPSCGGDTGEDERSGKTEDDISPPVSVSLSLPTYCNKIYSYYINFYWNLFLLVVAAVVQWGHASPIIGGMSGMSRDRWSHRSLSPPSREPGLKQLLFTQISNLHSSLFQHPQIVLCDHWADAKHDKYRDNSQSFIHVLFQNVLPRRSPSRTTVGSRPTPSSTTPTSFSSSSSASSNSSSNPDAEKEKMKSAKFEHLLRQELLAKIENWKRSKSFHKYEMENFPPKFISESEERFSVPPTSSTLSVDAAQLNLYSTNKLKVYFPNFTKDYANSCNNFAFFANFWI